jgi:fumarate reductase subunit C
MNGRPKPYVPVMPVTWWLRKPAWFWFMMREFSSTFVAAFAVVLLLMLYKLSQGKEAYEAFVAGLRSLPAIAFHLVALTFAVLHTVTWFNAAPQAAAVRVGEKRVPPAALVAGNYLMWALVSLAVYWVLTR